MPNRPYPYQPGTYQPAKGKQPGLEELSRLCRRRWRFTNLGTWVVRQMNARPVLSVHSTGNACDLGYGTTPKGRERALEACRWLTRPDIAVALGIVAVHDYSANPPRAWRCDRDAWRTFHDGELGPGGRWIHAEVDQQHGAMSAREYRRIWRALPKP